MTAQAVIASLLGEGREVTARSLVPDGTERSPDFLLTIDRQAVALEVVRFLPPAEVGKAQGTLLALEATLKRRLDPEAVALGRSLVLGVTFAVAPLADYGRRRLEADAETIARAIRGTLVDGLPEDGVIVELDLELPWLIAADFAAIPSPEPSFFIGATGGPDLYPDADLFVARVIVTKGDQHTRVAHRAILAVRCMFDDDEDLTRAFETRRSEVPWWRVYTVRTGGTSSMIFTAQPPGTPV